MRTIYRIETPDGFGTYRIDYDRQNASDIFECEDMRHPLPEDDSKLCDARELKGVSDEWIIEYRFGFASVDQLRYWVYRDTWLVGLHDIGMVISEYTCQEDDVLVGNTQAIFKNNVGRVSYSILKYFNLKETT